MTALTIYADTDPDTPLAQHLDFVAIKKALAGIGVVIERWEASVPLAPTAGPEEVMVAYRESIEKLKQMHGFQSMDVVAMHPGHPQAEAARGKFLSEHTHADFEIRF